MWLLPVARGHLLLLPWLTRVVWHVLRLLRLARRVRGLMWVMMKRRCVMLLLLMRGAGLEALLGCMMLLRLLIARK